MGTFYPLRFPAPPPTCKAGQNLNRKINEVFDKFDKKCDEVQKQYDKETDHGRNAEKQREWDKKISDWLTDPSKAPQP